MNYDGSFTLRAFIDDSSYLWVKSMLVEEPYEEAFLDILVS
jgi:hypothetical protein